jgi:hypothetical protein
MGYSSQPVLGHRSHAGGISSRDQLAMGARGRIEDLSALPGRRTMKFVRVLSRLALLSLAAGAFAALTGIYGASARSPLPDRQWRGGREHRPSGPEAGRFPELTGEDIVLATYAVAGRIVLRLRLSPASRSAGQPISLGLHQEAKASYSTRRVVAGSTCDARRAGK